AGNRSVLDFWSDHMNIPYDLSLIDVGEPFKPCPGELSAQAGSCALKCIEKAHDAAEKYKLPLVTLPVSKHAIEITHPGFTGHTEYLAEIEGKNPKNDIIMMLGGEKLKVITLTRHIPISHVTKELSVDMIVSQIEITHRWFLKWKKRKALFWIAGCNPHAGESGTIGSEEIDTIIPAVKKLRSKGVTIEGPFAGDTMFVNAVKKNVDISVSCYHDQGLGPLKMIHFDDGVNVTIGLDIVRTSVGHGTAFDIAGKRVADTGSFETAIKWAESLSE
ncbi:MAG: 4-hydroxythreonine-4-phosphate dehydrogenase PdxA, partial [bacterium]